ncbi:phosphonoacetaldehyde hydrolase [Jeongeupia chitinilytica]|uniref:Phosphonoacetaldehyde hydrolase n=1 Tax=Jeongeupia chitinilytica TaxID=1041641 RepID=A0ABQ3H5P0_9NEIS|nr:phosphonoacetaldehyde hydrolase [Jeongeupia chitinilytica]GHD69811.1 phosphonoacetaldehyde hydrolase [Jeongeupia chitinilytica]
MTTPTSSLAVEAAIFDWAGTLVDFGSLAPTQIFVEVFAQFDIDITLAQARGPMGLSKWQHIRTLLAVPAIQQQWQARFGRASTDEDVDAMYRRFMPLQLARVGDYSQPIDGARDTLAWLRESGIKVGSCSGYPREVMNVLLPQSNAAGISPDCVVAGDDLPAGGRPGPYMALANVLGLAIGDVRRCIKIDDTVPGIEEGRRAGMWCVGVTLSGNEVGYSPDELAQAHPDDISARCAHAGARLRGAGAHYIVESVADLREVVIDVDRRIRAGEHP